MLQAYRFMAYPGTKNHRNLTEIIYVPVPGFCPAAMPVDPRTNPPRAKRTPYIQVVTRLHSNLAPSTDLNARSSLTAKDKCIRSVQRFHL